jgi:two-component sensor histidine kinase
VFAKTHFGIKAISMSTIPNAGSVVEAKPSQDAADVSVRSLRLRIRQQEILATLGVTALQGASLDQLLIDTTRMTADGLDAEFCKIMEYIPAENALLVRAGVGWDQGVVGVARVGADIASPAGFALRTGKAVISNHLENEERFRTPEILRQHGIHRAMNVILQGDGKPFGVLEVDSKSDGQFVEQDIAFLQGAANILGMAIERDRRERKLEMALERQQSLLKEVNHRIKNSLSIVASMLTLQANAVGDPALTAHLEEAARRVVAVAKAHEQLYHGADVEQLDLGRYIEGLCREVDASVAHCDVHTNVEGGILIPTDNAISAALIVNELITNASKYAYQGKTKCAIWVTVARTGNDHVSLSVRDEGAGLPLGFDINKAKGLGMRIIGSLVRQMKGDLGVRAHNPGTEFIVTFPL